MKILLTGAAGYIGKRLLPVQLAEGHQVICCVRDKDRFDISGFDPLQFSLIEVNFLEKPGLNSGSLIKPYTRQPPSGPWDCGAVSLEEAWDFISSPSNLKEITPACMGFEISSPNLPEKIYPGLMISYWVRPLLGIKMAWLTEITHVNEPYYFVDEQRAGPFALWHHEHRLSTSEKGVIMSDMVTYRLPAGPLGDLAHQISLRKQLKGIFSYREQVLINKFGRP